MFSDLFGPSTHEIAQSFREFAIASSSQHLALLQLLVDKGVLDDADMKRLTTLQVQSQAVVDQLAAQKTDELLQEDSPEGERLRLRKKAADLLGPFLSGFSEGEPDAPKDDDDPKSKLH